MMTGHLNHVNNALHNVHNAQILIHALHVVLTTRLYLNAKIAKMDITRTLANVKNVTTHARRVPHNKYAYLVLLDMGLCWISITYVIHASLDILYWIKIVSNAQIHARNVKEYRQIV